MNYPIILARNLTKNPTEACFLHRAHIPYQRRPSPVPNFSNCQKKESIACTECDKCQKGRGPFLYGALKIHPVP